MNANPPKTPPLLTTHEQAKRDPAMPVAPKKLSLAIAVASLRKRLSKDLPSAAAHADGAAQAREKTPRQKPNGVKMTREPWPVEPAIYDEVIVSRREDGFVATALIDGRLLRSKLGKKQGEAVIRAVRAAVHDALSGRRKNPTD